MIDHLKTTNQTAIELLARSSDNIDYQLAGVADLAKYSSIFETSIKTGQLNDSATFKNIFGPNVNFYYVIQSVCLKTQTPTLYERGIGYIYEKDNSFFLKRVLPVFRGKSANECYVNYSGMPLDFGCSNESCYTYITSTLPVSYFESLVVPNSVLCSLVPFVPQPVPLQQNSFLSRLDGDIESVKFEDDRLVDKIAKIISKFTKQLKLKTSKLSLKRIESEVIDMVPSSNVKAKRGSLYYDESDNKLKLYDGEKWKTIEFSKD